MPPKSQRPKPSRILIVDDHPMMRHGLRQLVETAPEMTVCGEAGTAKDALEALPKLNPDLVLVDITLPDKNGLEFIKDARALSPGVQILVISMHDESFYAERVLRAGARGYVMKQEGGDMLMKAIRRALAGEIYLSDRMSAKVLELFSGKRAESCSPMDQLSDREFEVFQLIGLGIGTREIAAKLCLSAKTVEVHRVNIKRKLKVQSAPELVRYAVRWLESQSTGGM